MEKELPPVINLNVNWKNRAQARENAVKALAALEPVYRLWAEFAPREAYDYRGDQGEEDRMNTRCWAALRATDEYAAVKNALADYLRYTLAKNGGVAAFITANDLSVSMGDLFSQCVEYVLGKLPQILRNVNATFRTKKGEVGKAEGCLLYIDRTVFSYLIDQARKIDTMFGRHEKKAADLFEREGRPLRSAQELRPGDAIVRKGNRIGTYDGEEFRSGGRFAIFRFADGCDEYIPWEIVPDRIRRFTGNVQDIPPVLEEEEKKVSGNRPFSLDELIGGSDEDGIALINLLPCGKSGEEELLHNELCEVVRRTYLSTLRTLQEDFAKAIMLCVYVHDSLCLEFTHTDEIQRRLDRMDHLQLFRDLHERNCAIMCVEPQYQSLTPHRDPQGTSYTVKQLTAAKHQAKSLLRRNMTIAMAA